MLNSKEKSKGVLTKGEDQKGRQRIEPKVNGREEGTEVGSGGGQSRGV